MPAVETEGAAALAKAALPEASIFLVDPLGNVSIAAGGLRFPNGSIIAADGRFVVAETFGLRMSSFAIRSGKLVDRRKMPLTFAPDGIAGPDARGHIWLADPLGQAVAMLDPTGVVTRSIAVGRPVYACALGGHDLNTLFLCASSSADPAVTRERRDSALSSIRLAG